MALAALALHVSHEFDTPLEQFHDDPTHLILHGAYEASQARAALRTDAGEVCSDGRPAAAHITAGRPLSDAPKDVRWIHAGLGTIVDAWGPLPIFGHTVTVSGNGNGNGNGNDNDNDSANASVQERRPQPKRFCAPSPTTC